MSDIIQQLKNLIADNNYVGSYVAKPALDEIESMRQQLSEVKIVSDHNLKVYQDAAENLRQQLADSQKREMMLRDSLQRLWHERATGSVSIEAWVASRETLSATADIDGLILCEKKPVACRNDGRCQYAIDHGAEGLGHCPDGKCCMPLYSPKESNK